ncbi:MAG: tetratricopeptide repeat protein [Mariprofundaceae bacterium]|nr:tetratricopeptide repeat protein [Mariprofundaceae bacterium]
MNFVKVAIVVVLLLGVSGAIFGFVHNATEVERKQEATTKINQDRTEWLSKAEAGDIESMYQIGLSYAQPSKLQDYEQSLAWLKKASMQNHPKAQYYLGYMYAHGHGVEKNPAEATVWFWLAASNEERNSRRYLKLMANLAPVDDLEKARRRASEIWAEMPNKDMNKNKSALKYH